MGFFDAKNGRNMLPPEVAECDAKLMALAQQKQQMIFHIGELFVNTNNAESVAGSQYEEVWKALEQNAIEAENTEKHKLAVQGLRKCDKCGFILSIDSVFCNKCGEKQSRCRSRNRWTSLPGCRSDSSNTEQSGSGRNSRRRYGCTPRP